MDRATGSRAINMSGTIPAARERLAILPRLASVRSQLRKLGENAVRVEARLCPVKGTGNECSPPDSDDLEGMVSDIERLANGLGNAVNNIDQALGEVIHDEGTQGR